MVNVPTGGGMPLLTQLTLPTGAFIDTLVFTTGARCTFRNGSGTNVTGFTCVTPPTLGSNWISTVTTSPTTVATAVFLGTMMIDPPFSLFGQELLIVPDLGGVPSIGPNTFSFAIPGTNSAAGTMLFAQAIRDDGGLPVLMNAQELLLNH